MSMVLVLTLYSVRSVSVIAAVLGRAGQRGQQRRLEDAKSGVVTWENPAEISQFMKLDAGRKADEMVKAADMERAEKKMMGRAGR